MEQDLESLGLTELIRLRERLSEALIRRFERNVAIAFTEVIGLAGYFAEHGDEAGRGLQQRHHDLLAQVLESSGGRVIDTAGQGAFTSHRSVEAAAAAMAQLQELAHAQNATRRVEHHLKVGAGIHYGSLLTDGVMLTGDAVNLCARVTSTAREGEIRLTIPALLQLPSRVRLRCRPLPAVTLKGIAQPVEVAALMWREKAGQPGAVRIEETGEIHALPDKPIITAGRLREHEGARANDLVLALPDKAALMRISRWHFELRRQGDTLHLHPLSEQGTSVDGQTLGKGQSAPIVAGTVVRLADAMTLTFISDTTTDAEVHTIQVHHGGKAEAR
jgi:class 3 adenylate cyclase